MNSHACELLIAAQKLHHEELFNEALILSLGPWQDPQYKMLEGVEDLLRQGRDLSQIVDREHSRIMKEVSIAQTKLLEFTHRMEEYPSLGEELLEIQHCMRENPRGNGHFILPRYFRMCCETEFTDPGAIEVIRAALESLMGSGLAFYPRWVQSGKGDMADHFLCVMRDSIAVPWDESQTDF